MILRNRTRCTPIMRVSCVSVSSFVVVDLKVSQDAAKPFRVFGRRNLWQIINNRDMLDKVTVLAESCVGMLLLDTDDDLSDDQPGHETLFFFVCETPRAHKHKRQDNRNQAVPSPEPPPTAGAQRKHKQTRTCCCCVRLVRAMSILSLPRGASRRVASGLAS